MALIYSLDNDAGGLFQIDSAAGVISRKGILNAGTAYTVAYRVTDTTTGNYVGTTDTITATAMVGAPTGIVFEGDSITYGYPNSSPTTQSFPAYFSANTGIAFSNQGISGNTIQNMDANYARDIAPLYSASTMSFVMLMGGTNDLGSSSSPATDTQVLGWIQSFCSKARATGYKVMVACITPRSSTTNWTSQMEMYRQSVNSWLRNNWQTIADYLIDFETVPQAQDPTNATYYGDGIHPTNALYQLFAVKVQTVLGVPYYAPTTYSLTGPSSGNINSALTFTVAVRGVLKSAVTITPAVSGVTGTFSPASVTLSTAQNASATFNFTPTSAGTASVSTTNNGSLIDPTAVSVAVSSAPVVNYVRLTTVSGLTETTTPQGGWSYVTASGSDPNNYSNGYGIASVAIPAGAAGYTQCVLNNTANAALVLGIKASATNGTFGSMDFALYCGGGGYGTVQAGNGGGGLDTASTPAVGDVMRIAKAANGTVTALVSKDGGSTFTVVKTFTNTVASTSKMYITAQSPSNANPITNLNASSNVA